MNDSNTIENNQLPADKKNWEQKLWLWSVIIYATAEGIYWLYESLTVNCAACLHPAVYYIFQWLLNVVFTVTLWFTLHRFIYKRSWLVVIINLSVFVAYYFLWISIKYFLHNEGPEWLIGDTHGTYPFRTIIYDSWFDIGNYVLTATAFYVLQFYTGYRKAAEQRIQLAMINKDMQLNLLKQQLSPHFYFNTLNNLYGLARSNNPKLSSALQQLQNIMEYVIIECNQNKVSLQKEIDFLKSYIALERLRYEENTAIDVQVKGTANGYTILPLLLIQLVENAFKHGMKEKSELNWMKVNISTENEILFFSVNNSCHAGAFKEGVGLSSVKHRLNLQYEGKHDMRIINTDDQFSVLLELNLS
jgi:two-component system, LytTR family, sensor kinase